jgi:hypothetical protein
VDCDTSKALSERRLLENPGIGRECDIAAHRCPLDSHEHHMCRYPSGESYLDVIQRLEPVIIEIERERECVCVVAHQAILRALYGYFTKCPLKVRGPGNSIQGVFAGPCHFFRHSGRRTQREARGCVSLLIVTAWESGSVLQAIHRVNVEQCLW